MTGRTLISLTFISVNTYSLLALQISLDKGFSVE